MLTGGYSRIATDQRVLYLVVGGIAFILEYGSFLGMLFFNVHILVANSASFIVGFLTSFLLNKYWAFAGEHNLKSYQQLGGYLMLAFINIILVNIVIIALVGAFGISAWIAKVISMVLLVAWNYLLLSKLLFKRRKYNSVI